MASASDRLDTLTSWHADWRGLRTVVYGLGVTGFAAADTLAELGVEVLVVAGSASAERTRMLQVIGARLAETADQEEIPEELKQFDPELVIVSPGYHPDHPLVVWAQRHGIPVWGDIELAWRLRDKIIRAQEGPAKWILVTGTNGKTTTVHLTAAMLAAAGHAVAPCGNIGVPVLDAIRDPNGFDVLVVELSSYQLHWLTDRPAGALVPYASACLNIAQDHIDWHGSFRAYRDAKAKVYQGTTIACVYNRADPETESMVREADVVEGARAIGFGLQPPRSGDVGLVDEILCDRAFIAERATSALEFGTVSDLRERGLGAPHVIANILAATALARSFGAPVAAIRSALETFRLDAHRIEPVGSAAGIRWIDDSKATNPHAAQASLRAFDSVVWLVGGLLKGVEIDDLIRGNVDRLRAAVVIGVDRAELLAAFSRHAPKLPVYQVEADETSQIMPEAVRLASAVAQDGDVVLLAPAAASMDQFTDYAQRGRLFAAAVQDILGGEADGQSAS